MPHSVRKALLLSFWVFAALFGHALQVAAQTNTASYAGSYAGTYSGGDSGSFTAVIASGGGISVSGTGGAGAFSGSGQVSPSGSLQMTVGSVSTGSTFSGMINATTGALSGTWVNASEGVNGGFSGSRTSGGVTLNLQPGWNLVGNSSAAAIDVAAAFGDAGKFVTVWKWDQAAGKWALYAPSMSSSALATYAAGKGFGVLSSLAPRDGFWVNALTTGAVSGPVASGVTLIQSDLQLGWNLVSSADSKSPSQLNQALSSGLKAAGKAISTAWAWDAANGKWRFYAPSLEVEGGTALTDYVNGKGYLSFGSAFSAADGYWLNIAAVAAVPEVSALKSINTNNMSSHVLVVKKDGTIWGWGSNQGGQLGPQTAYGTLQPTPVQVSVLGSSFEFATTGWMHSFAFGPTTYTYAWGVNLYGGLGDGTATARNSPVSVLGGVKSLASSVFTALVRTDGSLWAWGSLMYRAPQLPYSPNNIGPGFDSVVGGETHVLALKTDGSVWSWGYGNADGQLGRVVLTTAAGTDAATPTQILTGVSKVWSGANSGYALKSDGTLWAWGRNSSGQLGDGTTTQRGTPIQVATGFVAGSAGHSHVVALKSDGSLWTWGDNAQGQLADGTTSNASVPKQVGTGYTIVAAGASTTLAATASGDIYGAGRNSWGELGNGTLTSPVTTLTKTLPFGSAGGGTGGTGTGLTGTWCTDISGDQNCWVFDNESGSATGSFYQQSINQSSGTLTNTMTWSVDTSAKTLTYRFTFSKLTNSSSDYARAVNQPAYTFPYTLDASTFTFQGIQFNRK